MPALSRTLVALALLLALPSASAVAVSTVSLTATGASLQGSPTALDYRADQGPGTAHLRIAASRLVVETDSAQYLQAGAVGVGLGEPATSRTDYGAGRLTAGVADGPTTLFLVPAGPLAVGARFEELEASVPLEACREQPDHFARSRQPLCPDLTASLRLDGSGAGPLHLDGSFLLVLWGWHGSIDGSAADGEFWSGARSADPAAPAGPTELRQVFVHAEGTLEILVESGPAPETFFPEVRVASEEVALATGAGAARLDHGHLALRREGQGIAAEVLGGRLTRPDGTVLDAGPRAEGGGWPSWTWLAAIGAVAAAAPTAALARRGATARRHLQHARDNVALGNFHAAARHAERALQHGPLGVPAGIVGAIALIRAGDVDDAQHFMAALARHGAEPAAVAYLNACLCAKAGRAEEARRWLDHCLRANPAYAMEARANPLLDGLAGASPRETGGAYT